LYACFTESKLNITRRYNLQITGEINYRDIINVFRTWSAEKVIIAMSNYDKRDIARYSQMLQKQQKNIMTN